MSREREKQQGCRGSRLLCLRMTRLCALLMLRVWLLLRLLLLSVWLLLLLLEVPRGHLKLRGGRLLILCVLPLLGLLSRLRLGCLHLFFCPLQAHCDPANVQVLREKPSFLIEVTSHAGSRHSTDIPATLKQIS